MTVVGLGGYCAGTLAVADGHFTLSFRAYIKKHAAVYASHSLHFRFQSLNRKTCGCLRFSLSDLISDLKSENVGPFTFFNV